VKNLSVLLLAVLLCLFVSVSFASSKAAAKTASNKPTLTKFQKHSLALQKGNKLIGSRNTQDKLKGARLIVKTYENDKSRFDLSVAAAKACSVASSVLVKQKSKSSFWGYRGFLIAKTITQKWPSRAEGYYWKAVNIGNYAKVSGVWKAITKGVAKKIKNNALKSIKCNPKLYGGSAQKVLGRYYFKLPWPWRNLKKSIKYLKQAHFYGPKNTTTQLFLAEALWKNGNRTEAKKFFRMCSKPSSNGIWETRSADKCKKFMKKNP